MQYEALQITRRQLTERLALQEPGSAEALLTQGLIDATDLLLRQFEQSEAYQAICSCSRRRRSWMQSAARPCRH